MAYPIYDAHGNNVGLISRNGANYAVSQERSYDAWGSVRAGIKDTTKLTYCANLGRQEDDKSGLIYMRARYYEPGLGRFVSEDMVRDGGNWYVYCGSDSINYRDFTGKARVDIGGGYWIEWQNKDGDLAWGDPDRQRGQYVGNGGGRLKHPSREEYFNETVKKLLRNAKNPKVLRTLAKAGNIGLGASLLTTSLDSAFLSDPAAFADMIDYVGGDWEILSGIVTVSSTGY